MWKYLVSGLLLVLIACTEQPAETVNYDELAPGSGKYNDSLRTKNAFFNWIDCFGPKCKSYTVGANIRIPKRAALWLVGSKELVIIEGNKAIDEKLIREILSKDPKKENWLYLVNIPKSGKTTWKRIDKGEEKPIVKTDENS